MNSYDKASNGNRTRGGMKKAAEIVDAFHNEFPHSDALHRVDRLLAATHALSFYSLTLSHGLPFQPVSIRAQHDPISLLGKVMEQNSRSYTKLDDLLTIGRNLVEAGLVNGRQSWTSPKLSLAEQEKLSAQVQSRITGMAIEAALAEDDFDTAYSYVMNRLARDLQAPVEQNETSWRAAFQAGRFRPTRSIQRSSGSLTNQAEADIRTQEMRMELLAQALLMAPPAALTEILGVWRRCEEELNVLLAHETAEDERWDDRGDQKVPGQFISSPPMVGRRDGGRLGPASEAPIGLFDVARGAAAALSKTAFPLRQADADDRRDRGDGEPFGDEDHGPGGLDEGRVRKRDVVSNIVTGGLASGIGWVLGATPVPGQDVE